MKGQPIDRFSSELAADTRTAVIASASSTTEKRAHILNSDYPDPNRLRKLAAQIKQHTLDHLDTYLEKAVSKMRENGVKVHFASDGDAARETVLSILKEKGARKIVKSKSMASEEIHLNEFLEKNGLECLESDLGEFIVQLDGDVPSHIVRPIIHKNRREIANTFEREGLGEYNDDPEVITRRARAFFRSRYMESDAGITGGNFISAESGRVALVTNEGNARLSMAPNRLHIALIGIEKVIPRDRDFSVFLNLLARSATAQQLTVYTQFISGPRVDSQPSGPDQMHVVLMDNGRSDTLGSNCSEILRCIRCGACQNVCPVYRQASGHAYRATYGGPVGAVLSPLLAGDAFPQYSDLPRASSLCGACREVCPVDIPIPDLLVKLRAKGKEEGIPTPGSPSMGGFARGATSPGLWRAGLRAANVMNSLPASWIPAPALRSWLDQRTLPTWKGGEFRRWMKERRKA